MTIPSSRFRIFRVSMIVLYALIGILVIFIVPTDALPLFNRIGLGCSLILYSSYRLWRYARHSQGNVDEETSS